jgi:hypothetical protein
MAGGSFDGGRGAGTEDVDGLRWPMISGCTEARVCLANNRTGPSVASADLESSAFLWCATMPVLPSGTIAGESGIEAGSKISGPGEADDS